jgi:hypothetical protein
VTYAGHHHDDRVASWCAAPEGTQRILVEADPDRFFVPPISVEEDGSGAF